MPSQESFPDDIPAAMPGHVLQKRMDQYGVTWLGTGTVANQKKVYLPPIEAKIEARKYQKKLGIKTEIQWIEAHKAGKIPANLPRYLANIYGPKHRKKK